MAAVRRYREAGDDAVAEAREASYCKYENKTARRGARVTAASGVTVETMRNEIINLEEVVRSALKRSGASKGWEGKSGERKAWFINLKRATEVPELADRICSPCARACTRARILTRILSWVRAACLHMPRWPSSRRPSCSSRASCTSSRTGSAT